MGIVYLARHLTLGRPAAIKVLHSSLSSNQDMVTRFFNEARAATAVRNPGIVEVFDFGMLEDRSAYIVMEFLEGENLGARLRRGRLSVAATMTIIRAIARSLQAAHEQGIVHRDLKPDNVFLVPDPEMASGERVKLLDFGIAKLAPISGEVSQTRTGMVMGTPTYMAPEQCRGAGSVDHRADLYALGCVAYQMMCGQPPFVSDGAGDLIARHLYFQPQPLRSLSPEIPADVDELVLWLLQKDPAARPASAADLVRSIDKLATASVPGVMQTQPPTRFSGASFAPVRETTLQGAASTVALPSVATSSIAPKPRRTPLFAGIGVGVVAVAAILIVMVRGKDGNTTTAPVAVAAPEERPTPPPVVATPPAPLPPTIPDPSTATPSVPAPPSTPPAVPVTPPATPTVATPPLEAVATPPPAAPDQADRSDRNDRNDRDRKKHSSRSRVAQHDPEPAPAATVKTEPATPPPAPATPVAAPPVAEAPPVAPPGATAKPVAPPPATPAAPTAPPVVSATSVSKVSGAVPAINVKGLNADFIDVVVKLCIDEQGAVASVKVVRAPTAIASDLRRGLQNWRYTPYVNASGVQTAACFPVSFRVVLKN